MPDTDFHEMINQALLGIYLADQKVQRQKEVKKMAKHLLNKGGRRVTFSFLMAESWLICALKQSKI